MLDTSTALYQIASLPAAGQDPEALLCAILEQSCAALGADIAILFQVDEQGGGFIPAAAHGAALDSVGRLSFSASAALLGAVVTRRQPLPLPASDPVAISLDLGAAVYAPAFGGDGLVGVLLLGRRASQPFDDETLALLQLASGRAAAVLESNAKLTQYSRRVHELSLMLQSTAEVSSSLEIDAILKSLAVSLLMASSSDRVTLSTYQPGAERVVTRVEIGRGDTGRNPEKPGTAFALTPATRRALSERRPVEVLASDPTADPGELELMRRRGTRALLMLPLVARGQPIGLVELAFVRSARSLNEREIELAQALANQAAIALLNARLYEASQAHAAELELLNQIGQDVTASLDLDQTLQRVLRRAREALGAQAVVLLLLQGDEATGEFVMRTSSGPLGLTQRQTQIVTARGIAGWVVRNRASRLVADTLSEPEFAVEVDQATGLLTRSVLAVPLEWGGRVLGVVEALNKVEGSFSRTDQDLLGAIAGWAAIAIENARLFQQAHEERLKLNAVLADSADGVLVTDPRGALLLVNEAAARAFGLRGTQPLGKPVGQTLPEGPLATQLAAPAATPGPPAGTPVRVEVNAPDGRIYQATISPVEGVGRVAMLRDITYLKELDRLRNQLLGAAAHDLKNPITAIKLAIELVPHSGPLTPQQRSQLESVSRASDRMVALISDLLDVAQIESGLELKRRPTDLAALARAAAQEQAALATAHGVAVQFALPPDLPHVLADPPRIEQVLNNLLSNAIKYTPAGGVVRVSAAASERQVRLSVADNGIGIGPDDLPRVFNRFFRVRSEQTAGVEGTGLGLSIVKSIVERHGGGVQAESEGAPGKGSTFSFTLPCAAG